jgi:hypothetical protein
LPYPWLKFKLSNFRLSNYNIFQPVGNNSQPSHLKIPSNDKNVKFLGKKCSIHFFRMFKFCGQNKGDCGDQRRRDGP